MDPQAPAEPVRGLVRRMVFAGQGCLFDDDSHRDLVGQRALHNSFQRRLGQVETPLSVSSGRLVKGPVGPRIMNVQETRAAMTPR